MTLAIGHKKGQRCAEGCTVSADTMVEVPLRRTYRADNSIPGILKIFVVSETLCFAFSGERLDAFGALKEIFSLKRKSATTVQDILLESHINSNEKTDYLFLDLEGTMVKTSHGKFIGGNANFLFVGNGKAASLVRSNYLDVGRAIEDPRKEYESVGGLVISATSNSYGFNYVSMYRSGLRTPGESTLGSIIGQKSDVYTYIVVVPLRASIPVIAIYFPEACVGFLYDHRMDDDAIKIPARTADDLWGYLLEKYEIPFRNLENKGVTFEADGSGKYSASFDLKNEATVRKSELDRGVYDALTKS